MKKNLIWQLMAVLGVLTFCFFNFPYISTHSGKYSSSENGYSVMGKWADGFSGGILALTQLLVWAVAFLLVIFSLYRIYCEITGKNVLESVCGLSVKGLSELAFLLHGILQLLFMIFAIIYTVNLSNGISYAVNIGAILNFILSVGLNIFYFTQKFLGKV